MPQIGSQDPQQTVILQTALEVFADVGIAAARVADIAARSGVGKGTVYLHFKRKEDLALAVSDLIFDEFDRWYEGVAQSQTVAELRAGLETVFEPRHRHAKLLSVLQELTRLPDCQDEIVQRSQQRLGRTGNLIARKLDEFAPSAPQVDWAPVNDGWLIVGMIQGVVFQAALMGLTDEAYHAVKTQAVTRCLNGLSLQD